MSKADFQKLPAADPRLAAAQRWFAVLLLACVGCGGGAPFEYIPVSGRVTYEDGKPIPARGIRLTFQPQDVKPVGDMFPRAGDAEIDAEGNFANATSYKYGDGLVPGKHKVAIFYATDAKGNLLIPKDYARPETTPLIVDTSTLPFEIKVPRP